MVSGTFRPDSQNANTLVDEKLDEFKLFIQDQNDISPENKEKAIKLYKEIARHYKNKAGLEGLISELHKRNVSLAESYRVHHLQEGVSRGGFKVTAHLINIFRKFDGLTESTEQETVMPETVSLIKQSPQAVHLLAIPAPTETSAIYKQYLLLFENGIPLLKGPFLNGGDIDKEYKVQPIKSEAVVQKYRILIDAIILTFKGKAGIVDGKNCIALNLTEVEAMAVASMLRSKCAELIKINTTPPEIKKPEVPQPKSITLVPNPYIMAHNPQAAPQAIAAQANAASESTEENKKEYQLLSDSANGFELKCGNDVVEVVNANRDVMGIINTYIKDHPDLPFSTVEDIRATIAKAIEANKEDLNTFCSKTNTFYSETIDNAVAMRTILSIARADAETHHGKDFRELEINSKSKLLRGAITKAFGIIGIKLKDDKDCIILSLTKAEAGAVANVLSMIAHSKKRSVSQDTATISPLIVSNQPELSPRFTFSVNKNKNDNPKDKMPKLDYCNEIVSLDLGFNPFQANIILTKSGPNAQAILDAFVELKASGLPLPLYLNPQQLTTIMVNCGPNARPILRILRELEDELEGEFPRLFGFKIPQFTTITAHCGPNLRSTINELRELSKLSELPLGLNHQQWTTIMGDCGPNAKKIRYELTEFGKSRKLRELPELPLGLNHQQFTTILGICGSNVKSILDILEELDAREELNKLPLGLNIEQFTSLMATCRSHGRTIVTFLQNKETDPAARITGPFSETNLANKVESMVQEILESRKSLPQPEPKFSGASAVGHGKVGAPILSSGSNLQPRISTGLNTDSKRSMFN